VLFLIPWIPDAQDQAGPLDPLSHGRYNGAVGTGTPRPQGHCNPLRVTAGWGTGRLATAVLLSHNFATQTGPPPP